MFLQWLSLFTFSYVLYDPNLPVNIESTSERITDISVIIQSKFGNDRPAGWYRDVAAAMEKQEIAGTDLEQMFAYCQYLITNNAELHMPILDACKIVSFMKARVMFRHVYERIQNEPAVNPNWQITVACAVHNQIPEDWVTILAKYCECDDPGAEDPLMELPCQVIALIEKVYPQNSFKRLQFETLAKQAKESYQKQVSPDIARNLKKMQDVLMDESHVFPASEAALGDCVAMLARELHGASHTASSSTATRGSSETAMSQVFWQTKNMVQHYPSAQSTINAGVTPAEIKLAQNPKIPVTFQIPLFALSQIPIVHDGMNSAVDMEFLRDMSSEIKRKYVDLKKKTAEWTNSMVNKHRFKPQSEIEPMFVFCQKEIRENLDNSDYWNACMIVSILRALCEFSKLNIILAVHGNQQDLQALVRQAIAWQWQSVLIEYCKIDNKRTRLIVHKKYDHICNILKLRF